MKIAVISPDARALQDIGLALASHAVTLAEGGKARIRTFAEQQQPDLLLIDGLCGEPDLLAQVEYVTTHFPAMAVILLCPERAPDFLLGAMRAGVREVLPSPATPAMLEEAVNRMAAKLAGPQARDAGKILAFMSCKGGSGATFIATNLGYQLAENKSVLLIDLNLQFGDALSFVHDGKPASTLAKLADVHLNAGVSKEACPMNLAPTASTTAALALGDALAVAVLDARGFGADDFARSHPGGALGRRLLTYVRDVMRTGSEIPKVPDNATLREALMQLTAKRMGMTAIVDSNDHVEGIFTDGDLRRVLERAGDFRELPIADVMTKGPRMIGPDHLAVEAVELMERHRINQMLVVDEAGKLIGALNMHDLFAKKVI